MSETKNTWRGCPLTGGPWVWSGDELLASRDGYSETVLLVTEDIWAPNDHDKALIAAAPDLLRLAQAIVRLAIAEELSTHVEVSFEPQNAAAILTSAQRAILKAEAH